MDNILAVPSLGPLLRLSFVSRPSDFLLPPSSVPLHPPPVGRRARFLAFSIPGAATVHVLLSAPTPNTNRFDVGLKIGLRAGSAVFPSRCIKQRTHGAPKRCIRSRGTRPAARRGAGRGGSKVDRLPPT